MPNDMNIIPFTDFIKTPTKSPYALMDLDDTLFQTKRKILLNDPNFDEKTPLVIASVDKQGQPLSFMTARQAHFFAWLHKNTTLIPVTARDRAEIQRVKLPFCEFKILTHGAVILDKDNQSIKQWEMTIFEDLVSCQTLLNHIYDVLLKQSKFSIRITPHYDEFLDATLMIYLAIKHQDKNHDELLTLAKQLPLLLTDIVPDFDERFYIHVNANNLALLPHVVHKRHAVAFLKTHLDADRACFGFGDSLADLPFLTLLDWYGTPNVGQLHQHITAHS